MFSCKMGKQLATNLTYLRGSDELIQIKVLSRVLDS